MCKFNSRLFVFLVVVSLLILAITAKPVTNRSLIDLLTNGNDYDLRYDQRQKGVENLRVKLDGFFIGIPAESTGLVVMTDELVNVLGEELLLGRHGEDKGQLGELKPSPSHTSTSELVQKQLENYHRANLEKADADALSQKTVLEGRGDFNEGSRTKVYIMNLLDYIRRNRRV